MRNHYTFNDIEQQTTTCKIYSMETRKDFYSDLVSESAITNNVLFRAEIRHS